MTPSTLDEREALDAPVLTARARFLRRFRRQYPALLALAYLVLVTLAAVAAPLLATHPPLYRRIQLARSQVGNG